MDELFADPDDLFATEPSATRADQPSKPPKESAPQNPIGACKKTTAIGKKRAAKQPESKKKANLGKRQDPGVLEIKIK